MKFINPSVEYWKQEEGLAGVWKQIARATRVCYQSTPKNNGESNEDFVKRVILKPALIKGDLNDLEHCKFNFDAMHGSTLEHGTIYLKISPRKVAGSHIVEKIYRSNKYSEVVNIESILYITTNLRVLFELDRLDDLEWFCEPTKYHKRRYTFSIITNIGVTKECNRHRVNSPSEESTRWCTYSAGKFGSEITYVTQPWMGEVNSIFGGAYAAKNDGYKTLFCDLIDDLHDGAYKQWKANAYYAFGLLAAEFAYMGMKNNHATNDMARTVLNHGTKTQEVITAFKDDWEHFLKLRADNASGKVHPDMQIIANRIKQLIKENNL